MSTLHHSHLVSRYVHTLCPGALVFWYILARRIVSLVGTIEDSLMSTGNYTLGETGVNYEDIWTPWGGQPTPKTNMLHVWLDADLVNQTSNYTETIFPDEEMMNIDNPFYICAWKRLGALACNQLWYLSLDLPVDNLRTRFEICMSGHPIPFSNQQTYSLPNRLDAVDWFTYCNRTLHFD